MIDAGRAAGILGGTAPTEPSMEQRIAQIAAQQGVDVPTVRVQILQKTATDQGLQLPPKVIQQYSVGLISLQDALAQGTPAMQTGSMGAMPMQQPNAQIQMQAGGMVGAELFEEGDSDINNALNTMASVSNPEVPDMPASNGMALPGGEMGGGDMMMDQGLEEMEVLELKAKYQEVALATVEAANKAIQEGAPPEQLKEPIKERLIAIDKQYRQKTGAEDTILTPEFMAKLQGLTSVIPAMQGGGEVSSLYVNTELDDARYVFTNAHNKRIELEDKLAEETNPRNKRRILQQLKKAKEIEVLTEAEYERLGGSQASIGGTGAGGTGSGGTGSGGTGAGGTGSGGTGSDGTGSGGTGAGENDSSEKILKELKELSTVSLDSSELQKKKQELARRAAFLGGKTKQSGLSGLFDVMGQADAAEVEAVSNMPQQLSSNETSLERMKMDIEAKRDLAFNKVATMTESERDALRGNPIALMTIFKSMTKSPDDAEDAIEFFIMQNWPLPAFAGKNMPSKLDDEGNETLTITLKTKEGTKEGLSFKDFFRLVKQGKPSVTYQQILVLFNKGLNNNGILDQS